MFNIYKNLFYLKLNHENTSFLEIGFNKTTIVIYEKNVLKLIYSIPVGSFHITKISQKFLKLVSEADEIKKLFNKSDTEFSYVIIQKIILIRKNNFK